MCVSIPLIDHSVRSSLFATWARHGNMAFYIQLWVSSSCFPSTSSVNVCSTCVYCIYIYYINLYHIILYYII